MAQPTRSGPNGSSGGSAAEDLLLLFAELGRRQDALLLQAAQLLQPIELGVVGMLLVGAELADGRPDASAGLLPHLPRPPAHPGHPISALGVRELAAGVAAEPLDAHSGQRDQQQRQDKLAGAGG